MTERADRVGQQIGDYRLLRKLGNGSFGTVYLGEHTREHTQAAVKVLQAQLTRSQDLKEFINEARMVRLKHPHILPLLDFGVDENDIPFLVMPYAPEGTLRDRYPRGTRLSLSTIVSYVTPLAAALQYAHSLHLIHRDVKPENIVLGSNGEIWLSDFGIVVVAQSTHSINIQQGVGGTLPYMAPEQIQGHPRPASDQYALGILVYEWLCGRRPFQGTAVEIAMQHAMTPPPPLRDSLPTLSSEVEQVVLTALAKDPKQRFATIEAFATALRTTSVQIVPPAVPPTEPPISSPSLHNIRSLLPPTPRETIELVRKEPIPTSQISSHHFQEPEPVTQSINEQALENREQQLRSQHPDTASSVNNQAELYRAQGKYTEAEPLYERALAIHEEQLGAMHPDTAQSLNNLANLYQDQGRYAEAEPLYQRALAIREEQLGAMHPDTAQSLNNLALLYYRQGKYTKAESLYRRALAIYEKQLGAMHPDTAGSLNNLALLYQEQGKYAEAEPLYERALAIREEQLGAMHPDTASSLNSLASLYRVQGKYTEAEPLYQRALAIDEQVYRPEHPEVATDLNNLASLYQDQGKYQEAEPLYQRALAIHEEQLGATHPDTAGSLNNLAALYRGQGRYAEAEPLFKRAFLIRQQTLGLEHLYTAQSQWWLATLAEQQGKYAEAKGLYEQAMKVYEQILGTKHPETQAIRDNYTSLLEEMAQGQKQTEEQSMWQTIQNLFRGERH